MADEINIDLPDGPISVPAWASEDTQQKLLSEFKKLYKLTDKEIKNAGEALKNDNKNSKAQLDALKQFGTDIKSAMDGRGSLLGGMGSGLKLATGGLTTFAKVGATATLALSGLALAVGSAVLRLSRGFGDDIKGAGLLDTGAAFGQLGAELSTLVPRLQNMGLSVDEAFASINDFNQIIKTGGVQAFESVITQFQSLTNSGSMYGKTIAQNIEFLSEELEFRQQMFVLDQLDSRRAAEQAQQVLDSQIESTQLLGKSVREISESAKSLIMNNLSLQSALAQLGPDAQTAVQSMLQTFSGAGISENFQAQLVQAIADPIFLASDEAQNLFNSLSLVPTEEADILQQELKNMNKAIASGNPDAVVKANVKLEQAALNFAGTMDQIENQESLRLLAQQGGFPVLLELLANQNKAREAMENFNSGVQTQVAKQVELSTLFDNQIKSLKQSFLSLGTSVKAGFAPFLENFTNALGKPGEPDSPIYQFRMRMNQTGRNIALSLEKIFGGGLTESREKLEAKQRAQEELRLAQLSKDDTESAEARAARVKAAQAKLDQADQEYQQALKNDQGTAKKGLNSLADYIDRAADIFLNIIRKLTGVDSDQITVGGIMTNLTSTLSDLLIDVFTALTDIVGQQFRSINWLDLFFGDSDREVMDAASAHMKKMNAVIDHNLEAGRITEKLAQEQKANIKTQGASRILNHAEDQDYSAEKTMNLLKDVGITLSDLTSSELVRVFKNPEDLAKAVTAAGGTQEDYQRRAMDMAEKFSKNADNMFAFDSVRRQNRELGKVFEDAATNVIANATNQPTGTPLSQPAGLSDLTDAINQDTGTGTPPLQPSTARVITNTEESETSASKPTSDDGTSTQSVKSVGILKSDGEANSYQAMEDKLDILNTNVMKLIDVNKTTSRNTAAIASNTN